MCVPIPPSVGSKALPYSGDPNADPAGGTVPGVKPPVIGSTTNPQADPSAIDYSRYAGMSPYDVRASTPNGLPVNWDWSEWMRVNPGAPDPRTHTNTGMAISPQNAALWNQPTTPAAAPPAVVTNPAARANNTAFIPPAATNPAARTNNTSPGAPSVLPATPGSQLKTTPDVTAPAPAPATPAVSADPLQAAPLSPPGTTSTATYSGTAPTAYGPGSTLGDTPTSRVSNALARRFKPEGWY